MKPLPQLDRQQLNEPRQEILGQDSSKFPNSFLFEQLFYERSALCRINKFSDRIRALLKKYPSQNTDDSLKVILPATLEYLRENDFLGDSESETCLKLIS